MIIKFENIQEASLKNYFGGEKELVAKIYVDECNKIVNAKLEPGASIGMHIHEDTSEIMYILSGSGKYIYEDKEEKVSKGMCHYCPKGHSHSLINDGNEILEFFAVIPKHE